MREMERPRAMHLAKRVSDVERGEELEVGSLKAADEEPEKRRARR